VREREQVTVNSMPPFAFYGVAVDAVPFVSVRLPGDGATLLTVAEALNRTPINLVNDVLARWSVERVIMTGGGGGRRCGRGAAEALEKQEEQDVKDDEAGSSANSANSAEPEEEVGDYEPGPGEEEYCFWPGGRLRQHGDDVAAEEAAAKAWRPSERDEEQLALWVAGLKDVDPD
jgi:hypothetical protein